MIDPITAVGLATSAFKGIKSAISAGRDIQDMAGQLGQWAKAISDVNYATEKVDKPKWWKALGGGHRANAVEVWAQKKKVDNMREELRSYISTYYGPSAWKEILSIEAAMRKEQKEAVYKAQEMKETIIEWTVGIIFLLIGIAVLIGVVWLLNQR
tara:strand:- start:7614 stop:8078 length:465 start_codon:yes stop_codon:yes gene_type:complete